jgi:hypothetical protein
MQERFHGADEGGHISTLPLQGTGRRWVPSPGVERELMEAAPRGGTRPTISIVGGRVPSPGACIEDRRRAVETLHGIPQGLPVASRAHPYEHVHARPKPAHQALPHALRKIPSRRRQLAPPLTPQKLPMSSLKTWLGNAVSLAAVFWMCVGCTRKMTSLRELQAGPSFSATVQKVQVVRMKPDPDKVFLQITIKPAKGSTQEIGITTVDPQLIRRAESLVVGKQYVFPDALTK